MIFKPLPVTNLHPQNIRVRDWMRDSDFEKLKKCLETVENAGSGERIRTSDLRVMRPQVFVTLQLSIFLQKYIYPLL